MAAKYLIFKETSDQDLAIESGDFVLLEDQDAVQQQVGTNLRHAKNDWFLDLDEGLRWVGSDRGILGHDSLSSENEAEIKSQIQNTFGVTQIIQFAADFLTPEDFAINSKALTEFSTTPISITN